MIALFNVLIILLAIPAGFLIAYFARDELIQGRNWFVLIMILSVLFALLFLIINSYYITLTLIFILIATLVSYLKSFDKNWTN